MKAKLIKKETVFLNVLDLFNVKLLQSSVPQIRTYHFLEFVDNLFLLTARLKMRSKIGMLRSVIKSLSDPIEPDLNCALESLCVSSFSLQFHFMYCIHLARFLNLLDLRLEF